MKHVNKFIVAYFIVVAILGYMYLSVDIQDAGAANSTVVIPEEAIRLRIIANSDNEKDQAIKRVVRDAVNKKMANLMKDVKDVKEARVEIREKLPEIEAIVKKTLKQNNISTSYQVKFTKVSFPTKLYGNFLYPAGKYEAILITLGEGDGKNWWCVLFPQLCVVETSTPEVKALEKKQFAFDYAEENQVKLERNNRESEVVKEEKEEIEEVAKKESIVIDEEKTEKLEVRFFLRDLFFGR